MALRLVEGAAALLAIPILPEDAELIAGQVSALHERVASLQQEGDLPWQEGPTTPW